MDTLTIAPSQSLTDFCAAFISRHKEHWPPDEGTLAQEFTERFPLGPLSRPEQIIAYAKGLGIDASLKVLPDEMHGFNCSIEEQAIVFLSEQESFPGSREHTLFHELREIMEYRFSDQGLPTAQGQELEKRAEQFATQVRIFGLMKEFGPLFDNAKAIEQTWKRVLAFVGLLTLTLGVGATYFLLPYFEEQFPTKSK